MKNRSEKDRTISVLKDLLVKEGYKHQYKNNTDLFKNEKSGKIDYYLHQDKSFDQYVLVIFCKNTIPDKLETKVREICEGFGLSYTFIIN